jgi:ADP-ribosyl-[dinitrogen reductase] hydrolase
VLPVALATFGQSENEVRRANAAQAHVTHHCVLSDAACECLIFMVQDALRGASKNDLLHKHAHPLAAKYPAFKFRAVKQIANPSGYVADTLQAVFQSLFDTDDLHECLTDVVNRGGDADTTGAIAGMLAGAMYGLEEIPDVWLKVLDSTTASRCATQAQALLQLP